MPHISANNLKIKGVSAIEAMLATQPEAVISVRGKERFVVMDMDHYHYLRECELESVLARVRAKVPGMDARRLRAAVKSFAKVATRKLLEEALGERCLSQNQPPSIPPCQGGGLATADGALSASGSSLSPSLDKGRAGEGLVSDSGEGVAFDSAYLPYNKKLTALVRKGLGGLASKMLSCD